MPDGWEWCNLGLLFSHNTGKALNSSNKSGTQLEYITTSNVYWDRFELDNLKTMPFTDDEIDKCTVKKGDLLVCEGGDIGRSAIWNFDKQIRIQNHLHRLRAYDKINTKFYYYILYLYKLNGVINGNGIGLQGLSSNVLHKITVPVPPAIEQEKIAEQITELLAQVDTLDTQKIDLTNCITQAKSKILDLAIRGQLVPQDPADEPASVLLDRIRAEKEELIKQGKIKRDKKESVIFKGEDNSYYDDIPQNWAITSLGELTTSRSLNDGDWILSENMVPSGTVKLIQLGSVGYMKYIEKGFKYLSDKTFDELKCTEIFPKYMLINRIISDKMCVCILPQIEGKLITTVDTCWVAPDDSHYNLRYLMYAMSAPSFQSLVLLNSAGTTRKRISKNNLIHLPILCPPLKEQLRIVKAIEILFEQLDNIASTLE